MFRPSERADFVRGISCDVRALPLPPRSELRAQLVLYARPFANLDAVQRIDLQIINPPQQVSRHEKLRAAIMALRTNVPNDGNGQQPNGDGSPPAGS